MKQSELNEVIKNEISSRLVANKKYFDVVKAAKVRCQEYIANETDKENPGFTDYVDFEMEAVFYSAIEESVQSTLNVLASLGVLQVDD